VQVRWLMRALKNLNNEAEYIARDDPEADGTNCHQRKRFRVKVLL